MTVVLNAEQIQAQINHIRADIPSNVRLVAISKKFPAAAIRAAYAIGIRDFGESQVQEAISKQAELADLPDIVWHLVGHLQSNKVRKAVEHFQWIHSVDSLKLAERLNQIASEVGSRPYCCLQVKMVPDPPKYGFDAADLMACLPQLNDLTHLHWAGLMTIPPLKTPADETQAIFQAARALAETINQAGYPNLHLEQLSMGMSGDYPIAIAAGATMVRLGTILFGTRPQPARGDRP